MVQHTISTYGACPIKVFVAGSSSDCMMATFPDVFAAATCYSAVPAGCLAGSPGASPITADLACASDEKSRSTSSIDVTIALFLRRTTNGCQDLLVRRSRGAVALTRRAPAQISHATNTQTLAPKYHHPVAS
jgi:hypothetical protein